MIILSINVLKLDKARFKNVTLKNGDAATFCDLVLIETPNGQYGDYMVKQGVTKEESAARKEMPILGNGKIVGKGSGSRPAPAAHAEPPADGKVPF